jgi:CRP-like cAMP-binding protein
MNLKERALVLSQFLDCSDGSASALARAMRTSEFAAKDLLCHQGDTNQMLWIVLNGTVQLQAISIEGQTTAISVFGPGELLGGLSEFEDGRAYDTRALSPVLALEIDALHLRDLMKEWTELGVGLSRIFSGQLDAVLDRLAARVTLSATGRFYRELLRFAGSCDTISPPPVISALALSAQTTRETGSRATSMLERRGIIARDADQLTIVSRRMLEDLIF